MRRRAESLKETALFGFAGGVRRGRRGVQTSSSSLQAAVAAAEAAAVATATAGALLAATTPLRHNQVRAGSALSDLVGCCRGGCDGGGGGGG